MFRLYCHHGGVLRIYKTPLGTSVSVVNGKIRLSNSRFDASATLISKEEAIQRGITLPTPGQSVFGGDTVVSFGDNTVRSRHTGTGKTVIGDMHVTTNSDTHINYGDYSDDYNGENISNEGINLGVAESHSYEKANNCTIRMGSGSSLKIEKASQGTIYRAAGASLSIGKKNMVRIF